MFGLMLITDEKKNCKTKATIGGWFMKVFCRHTGGVGLYDCRQINFFLVHAFLMHIYILLGPPHLGRSSFFSYTYFMVCLLFVT